MPTKPGRPAAPGSGRALAPVAGREPLRVLFVEDRPSDVELCRVELARAGFDVAGEVAETPAEFRTKVCAGEYDVILSDYGLQGWTGMDALEMMREVGRDIPFVLVTGSLGDEAAVDCVKRGAVDYVIKDRLSRLAVAVRHALAEKTLRDSRSAAMHAMQESEERFRGVYENTTIGLYRTTPDGRIVMANPALIRMLGYATFEELAHRNLEGQGYEPDYPRAEFRRRIESAGEVVGWESAWARADGATVWVRESARVVRDSDGKTIFYDGTVEDITERKRAELDLTLKNVILSTQQETSLDGILVVDEHGHILSFNRRFVELWSIPAEVAASKSDARALDSVIDKLVDPAAFLVRVAYLYGHREEKSQEEIALNDGRIFDRYSAPMLGGDGRYYGRVWYFRDITDRRRAAEELKASETRFRSLTEHSMDLVTILGPEGRVAYVSPSVTRLLGYGPLEMVGQVAFDHLHPEDLASVQAAFVRALGGDTAEIRQEFRFRHKDGSWRAFEAVVTNLLREPTVAGLVINCRDITERRKAQETLRWEQFLMDTLMENVPDAIYFKDAQSRFLRVNRALARRFGLDDPAQAVGKTDFDFFAREHAQAALETEQAVIRSGRPAVDIEERESWPDRPDTWASSTKMPLRDAGGAIVGTFGISRDITERKRAEELLRRSEADYRGLVEHSPLGIYRSTLDGQFLMVNPALVAMLGYASQDEMQVLDMGRDVYADPGERERLIRENPPTAEIEWKRKDGTRISVRLSSREVPGPDGEGAYFEGLVGDITEQRNLENQFRQAQRLEAVGRLAGGVAHDFNNVLTAITGYAELLLDELAPDDPKRGDIEEIRAAARRATTLTRQLLAFSRKQVLQTRVLDLNAVVQTLEKMLQRLIGEDVKLEVSAASALGSVRADPGQLEQVILNLAVNSRDAMPDGGRLTIETANADLDEAYAREHAGVSPGRYVMLAVSDTGTGMDAETQSHIFEPFFTTKEQGKGTGLGLATVYGIVKQSGGYVWVYSERGHGTTFKIYLPRVDEPAEVEGAAPVVREAATGSETVLLAEDDGSVRAIVADVLTQRGYQVLRAASGQAALEMAHAHPGTIQLLITDMVMPGMTGRDLAQTLVAERPGVRVLYMSGYTDDAVVRHGVLEEGMPYLQKPFTPRALALKVRDVLDRPATTARPPA